MVIDPLVIRQLIWIAVGTALMTWRRLLDYRALEPMPIRSTRSRSRC